MEQQLTTQNAPVETEMPLNTPDAVTLLAEMKEALEQQNKLVRRRTFFSQLTLLALIIIMIMMAIGVGYVVPPIVNTLSSVQATVDTINAADIPAAIASVQGFAITGEATLRGINAAVQNLQTLDVATLNKAIGELEATVSGLSKLDISQLNAAISNLNLTIAPLAKVIAAMQKTLRIP